MEFKITGKNLSCGAEWHISIQMLKKTSKQVTLSVLNLKVNGNSDQDSTTLQSCNPDVLQEYGNQSCSCVQSTVKAHALPATENYVSTSNSPICFIRLFVFILEVVGSDVGSESNHFK